MMYPTDKYFIHLCMSSVLLNINSGCFDLCLDNIEGIVFACFRTGSGCLRSPEEIAERSFQTRKVMEVLDR